MKRASQLQAEGQDDPPSAGMAWIPGGEFLMGSAEFSPRSARSTG